VLKPTRVLSSAIRFPPLTSVPPETFPSRINVLARIDLYNASRVFALSFFAISCIACSSAEFFGVPCGLNRFLKTDIGLPSGESSHPCLDRHKPIHGFEP